MFLLMRYVRAALGTAGVFALLGAVFLLISLTLPVKVWRTGELPTEPIRVEPAGPFSPSPLRVWIDTDAACGRGQRTDPDDCLAMLLLARDSHIEIIGVSTVFGNAPLPETDQTTRALMAAVSKAGAQSAPVYRGSSRPLQNSEPAATAQVEEAHEALYLALAQGPLTIVALGPLTNVAIALEQHPELRMNVTRLVAVMGRRKGHVFHPIEGATAHSFLGHGPIFRDFNFTEDAEAATRVVAMELPTTLVPYEAARSIVLTPTVLDEMEVGGDAAAWVAAQARPWLAYWRQDIGLEGFYPFDLVAAAYLIEPSFLHCGEIPLTIEDDTWLFGWLGYRALFVAPDDSADSKVYVRGSALYCPDVSPHLERWLADRLIDGTDDNGRSASQVATR